MNVFSLWFSVLELHEKFSICHEANEKPTTLIGVIIYNTKNFTSHGHQKNTFKTCIDHKEERCTFQHYFNNYIPHQSMYQLLSKQKQTPRRNTQTAEKMHRLA